MKIIEPSVKIIQQEEGLDGLYKSCAEAAYICYQTDPQKAKLLPKDFIEKVVYPNDHGRVLEFGTVYLKIPYWHNYETTDLVAFFRKNNWSRVRFFSNPEDPSWLVTTNLRVLFDNNKLECLEKYLCEPTLHYKRYTVEFILSRGAGDDFRTHVGLSSIMESTRWNMYSKDKFGNELTFIKPYWFESVVLEDNDENIHVYEDNEFAQYEIQEHFKNTEKLYNKLSQLKLEPQQLKRILPLGLKTQLRMCGFKDAWENFFYRRCSKLADPECCMLAERTRDIINMTV